MDELEYITQLFLNANEEQRQRAIQILKQQEPPSALQGLLDNMTQ